MAGPGVNSRRAELKSLLNCGRRCAMDDGAFEDIFRTGPMTDVDSMGVIASQPFVAEIVLPSISFFLMKPS